MKSDAQPSLTGKLKNIGLIPVYLKSLNGTLQVIQISFRSMDSVMSYIEKIERVAKKEFMVLFYGRVLTSSMFSKIEPFDSLSVAIRGKGGMLGIVLFNLSQNIPIHKCRFHL